MFVQVSPEEGSTRRAVEVPLEPDGALSLATLRAQFPGARALAFRGPCGLLRALRCARGRVLAPDAGWRPRRTVYLCVCGSALGSAQGGAGDAGPDVDLSGGGGHVRVSESEGEEAVELPVGPDGSLPLAALNAWFSGACGLRTRAEGGQLRAARAALGGRTLLPPPAVPWPSAATAAQNATAQTTGTGSITESAWGDSTYFCVFPSGARPLHLAVVGLSLMATPQQLRAYFSAFGSVRSARTEFSVFPQLSCVGFVRFGGVEHAEATARVLAQRQHAVGGDACEVSLAVRACAAPPHRDHELQALEMQEYFLRFGGVRCVLGFGGGSRACVLLLFEDAALAARLCGGGEGHAVGGACVVLRNAPPDVTPPGSTPPLTSTQTQPPLAPPPPPGRRPRQAPGPAAHAHALAALAARVPLPAAQGANRSSHGSRGAMGDGRPPPPPPPPRLRAPPPRALVGAKEAVAVARGRRWRKWRHPRAHDAGDAPPPQQHQRAASPPPPPPRLASGTDTAAMGVAVADAAPAPTSDQEEPEVNAETTTGDGLAGRLRTSLRLSPTAATFVERSAAPANTPLIATTENSDAAEVTVTVTPVDGGDYADASLSPTPLTINRCGAGGGAGDGERLDALKVPLLPIVCLGVASAPTESVSDGAITKRLPTRRSPSGDSRGSSPDRPPARRRPPPAPSDAASSPSSSDGEDVYVTLYAATRDAEDAPSPDAPSPPPPTASLGPIALPVLM